MSVSPETEEWRKAVYKTLCMRRRELNMILPEKEQCGGTLQKKLLMAMGSRAGVSPPPRPWPDPATATAVHSSPGTSGPGSWFFTEVVTSPRF